MARIRTHKPEFWSHPVMGRQDDAAKLLALALMNFSDDEGFFYADPAVVRAFARPFDEQSSRTRAALEILAKIGFIEVQQHPLRGAIGRIPDFLKHQRIDRGTPSEIKNFWLDEDSTNARRMLDAGKEGKGKERIKEVPPTPMKGPKAEELDRYPPELHEAVSTWRGLLKALRTQEDRFPVDKRFLPNSVGTVETTWRAWEKHLAKMVQGHTVTHGDILAAVNIWAAEKLRKATAGVSLAAPMLPTMINHADFVDALVRAVKIRVAKPREAPDAP